MWTVLPEICEPDMEVLLDTSTPRYAGSGPAGGGALLPGSVLQPVRWQLGTAAERVQLPPLRTPEGDRGADGAVAVPDHERAAARGEGEHQHLARPGRGGASAVVVDRGGAGQRPHELAEDRRAPASMAANVTHKSSGAPKNEPPGLRSGRFFVKSPFVGCRACFLHRGIHACIGSVLAGQDRHRCAPTWVVVTYSGQLGARLGSSCSRVLAVTQERSGSTKGGSRQCSSELSPRRSLPGW
jgi:hypothetical protein